MDKKIVYTCQYVLSGNDALTGKSSMTLSGFNTIPPPPDLLPPGEEDVTQFSSYQLNVL
jgi:hypothetical protein